MRNLATDQRARSIQGVSATRVRRYYSDKEGKRTSSAPKIEEFIRGQALLQGVSTIPSEHGYWFSALFGVPGWYKSIRELHKTDNHTAGDLGLFALAFFWFNRLWAGVCFASDWPWPLSAQAVSEDRESVRF